LRKGTVGRRQNKSNVGSFADYFCHWHYLNLLTENFGSLSQGGRSNTLFHVLDFVATPCYVSRLDIKQLQTCAAKELIL
jgi:hypothetical protein